MKIKFQKIKTFIISHRKTSIAIFIVIIALGYFGGKAIFTPKAQAEYITTTVKKGNIVSSITGTGQVEAFSQIDLKPKTSGDVVFIGVKSGDVVKKGKTLFVIDARDARKNLRDAEMALESAKLSLEKLQIQNSDENMSADLSKAYDDGFTSVSNAFLDIPSIMTGVENLFGQRNLTDNDARIVGKTAQDYRDKASDTYDIARIAFENNQINFRKLDRNSNKSDIDDIINETYNTTKLVSDSLKNLKNYVDYMADYTGRTSDFSSYQNTLSGYINTINGHLSSIFSAKNNIKNYKDSSVNSNLDIKSSLLSVQQKENSLQDAKDKLSDYYITAPFDGVVANITAKVGDTASGTLGSIITDQKLATISLNEVDIAKIKLGQKATLTFDAIEDLTITGEVAEIDSIGTTSQGVVTYNVKINFDKSDERVKPGMSISATIINDTVQDVLTIPNSAIKNKNGITYVEIFDSPLALPANASQGSTSAVPPRQVKIKTGLSNDTSTEITSGLKEGDIVVVKTIAGATSTKTTTQTPSLFGSMGGSKTGGAIRNIHQ